MASMPSNSRTHIGDQTFPFLPFLPSSVKSEQAGRTSCLFGFVDMITGIYFWSTISPVRTSLLAGPVLVAIIAGHLVRCP